MNVEAIERHLARQFSARSMKKQKDEAFEVGIGSGNVWTNKKTEATTPRTLKISNLKREYHLKQQAFLDKQEKIRRNKLKKRISPYKRTQ